MSLDGDILEDVGSACVLEKFLSFSIDRRYRLGSSILHTNLHRSMLGIAVRLPNGHVVVY